jgi:hypothetical protein
MILPTWGVLPYTFEKAKASNARRSLSYVVIFSLATNRIGI